MLTAPPVPFPAFTVELQPPPPIGPAVDAVRPSLVSADFVAAVAMVDVPVYARAGLDPTQKYTARVTYNGKGGDDVFSIDGVAWYKA